MITRTVNEVEVGLAEEEKDMISLAEKLERLGDLLEEVIEMDQRILDAMMNDECTDEEYEEEVIIINEYKTKIRMARLKLSRCLNKKPLSETSESQVNSASAMVNEGGKRKPYKLPNTEIKKFGGCFFAMVNLVGSV